MKDHPIIAVKYFEENEIWAVLSYCPASSDLNDLPTYSIAGIGKSENEAIKQALNNIYEPFIRMKETLQSFVEDICQDGYVGDKYIINEFKIPFTKNQYQEVNSNQPKEHRSDSFNCSVYEDGKFNLCLQ